MTSNMDLETPRSAGYLQNFSAGQLKSSGRFLLHTLSTLKGNCEYKSVNNPSAKNLLSEMHIQTVNTHALVEKSVAGIDDYVSSTDASDVIMQELAATFLTAKAQLDGHFLTGNFDNHVQDAVGLNRWFSDGAKKVKANLTEDKVALSRILNVVVEASGKFLSDWTRISDKTRNEIEAKRSGLEAKQTYAAVLEQHWAADKFNLHPPFPHERMDLLSMPSIDKEMQLLGNGWAREILGEQKPKRSLARPRPGRHANSEEQEDYENKILNQILEDEDDTLARILETHKKVKEIAGQLDELAKDQVSPKIKVPDYVESRWLNILTDLKADSRDQPLRIGVFGIVKHGKTSIINSLIGSVLLHADDKAATAWPLLVKHKPGSKDPEVKIDLEHFQPYVTFVRDQKFSQRWQESSDDDDTTHKTTQHIEALHATERLITFLDLDDLKRFESPDFYFLENPKGSQIPDTFIDINKLMRCCYVLTTDSAPFPALKNANWPCVEVEFATWGSNVKAVELLDLPGLDERETRTPEHIFNQAMQMGVDGCIVAVLPQEAERHAFTDMVNMQTHGRYQEPALAAFVTRSEGKDGDRAAHSKMANCVWKNPKAERRVVFCGPGLYASVITAMIFSFGKGHKELVVPGIGAVSKPGGGLKELREFWDSLPCTEAVHTVIGGRPNGLSARTAYNGYTRGTWKLALDHQVTRCRQAELVTHFERYVLKHGVDRRQLYGLTQARADLRGLMALQSDLISTLISVLSPKDSGGERLAADLHAEALKALVPWNQSGKTQEEELKKTLSREIADAETRAKAIVTTAVQGAPQDMWLPINEQDVALDFINGRGTDIKKELATLAREYVSKIRGIAREAWETRIMSLASKLREIYELLPLELMDTLQANAIDPDQAVREALTREFARKADSSNTVEAKWKQAKAKPWLSHQVAQAVLTSGSSGVKISEEELKDRLKIEEEVTTRLQLSPEEATIVKAINGLGYLLRAPVSGDAKTSPLFRSSNWPMLTGTYPVTFKTDVVTDTFIKALVDPWIDILRKDSERSVVGSVQTASEIASDQLKAIITRRTEWHDEIHKFDTKTLLESGVINQLVLGQARCSLLYGAVDEICDRWMDGLSFVLPSVYKAAEKKEKQANVIFAAKEDRRFAAGADL